jgi:hypothetical protein
MLTLMIFYAGPLLPPKKSHVLYACQWEAYKMVLSSGVCGWVADGEGVSAAATSTLKASTSVVAEAEDAEMTLRRRRRKGKGKNAERDVEEEKERQWTAEVFACKGAGEFFPSLPPSSSWTG